MAKNSVSGVQTLRLRHLYWLSFIVLLGKLGLVLISNEATWLGADGENYLRAMSTARSQGIFSSDSVLLYYPAGYSLFLFTLSIFGEAVVPQLTILLQTCTYSVSVLLLGKTLLATRVSWAALPVTYLLLLNPTLSLSSLQVGYESPVASLIIFTATAVLRDLSPEKDSSRVAWVLGGALALGLAAFLNPKFILQGVLVLALWMISRVRRRLGVALTISALVVFILGPAALSLRSYAAVGSWIPASNLGTVAIYGAGPNATGHGAEDTGIECETTGLSEADASSKKFRCTVDWYLSNPVTGATLVLKKSVMFWSPWYGPLAEGSQGRNLYNKVHPVRSLVTTQSMADVVTGPLGLAVSWAWVLGGWIALFAGCYALIRLRDTERILGLMAATFVGTSWLIAAGTQGDHRYRVPIMGMSLLLQIVGLRYIFGRGRIPSLPPRTRAISLKPNAKAAEQAQAPSLNPRAGASLSKSARRKRR